MRGKKISADVINECIRLRSQDRLSYAEICKKTGVAKGSLSPLLKEHQLSEADKKRFFIKNGESPLNKRNKFFQKESKYYQFVKGKDITRQDKAKIAESAVLFRLCLLKYIVYGSPFDGDKADWLIEKQDNPGRTKRIQVRWVKSGEVGLPLISLVCMEHGKQRRFQKGDFDFIIGYCLFNDTAYVYSFEETEKLKATISVSEPAAEAWLKLTKEET
jgi:transcriptional regulator with XRE-family HTH domain